ncbi:hypothetical protein SAMN06297422_10719 [Lachnospiraceae bacterium]|nr:hypothetical protein SAMN06297422_10719 [Lachnospiraceae bacterium]
MSDENEAKKPKREATINQRVTQDAYDRLTEITNSLGFEKFEQNSLEAILEILENNMVLTSRKKYSGLVKSVNQYSALINSKMISLLADLDTDEARVRTEYEDSLNAKDKLIRELQDKLEVERNEKKNALENESSAKTAQSLAEKNLYDAQEQLKKYEETIKDKESINQMLEGKLKEADDKLKGYDDLKRSVETLTKELMETHHANELMEKDNDVLKRENSDLKHQVLNQNAELNNIKKAKEVSDKKIHDLQRDLEEQKKSMRQEFSLSLEKAVNREREERVKVETELEILKRNNKGKEQKEHK